MNVNIIIFIKHKDSVKNREEIVDYYSRAADRIMQEIKTFADFNNLVYSNGSNVISLSANWKRECLRSLTKKILKIREINNLLMFPDYLEKLNDAKEMHDFFKVVAYSSTLLESDGKQILIEYYKKQNKDRVHNRIGELTFNATIIMLYSNGIIDRALFDDINHVRKFVLSTKKVKVMEDLRIKLFVVFLT